MEFEKFASILKQSFPDKAIDIFESLGLLKETLSDTYEDVNQKIGKALKDRAFEQANLYTNIAQMTDVYEVKIENVLRMLEIDEVEVAEEFEEESEKRIIKNYDDYVVNQNVEHTLYENFTHKRPYAFKVNDENIIHINTWQDMFIKTCQYLYSIDKKKFINFEKQSFMNGKKKKYFATDSKELRKAGQVASNAFVETNQSANGIRNLIIKMLKQYGFKTSEYKVFFRADYSTME